MFLSLLQNENICPRSDLDFAKALYVCPLALACCYNLGRYTQVYFYFKLSLLISSKSFFSVAKKSLSAFVSYIFRYSILLLSNSSFVRGRLRVLRNNFSLGKNSIFPAFKSFQTLSSYFFLDDGKCVAHI
jgi:hypothetical protein